MKKQLIFLFFISTLPLFGQIIGRKVFASGGGTEPFGSNLYISYSIGEPVVGTVTGNGLILNQGFEQSDLTIVATVDIKESLSATVFPNPAKNELVILVENNQESALNVKLYNLLGQLVLSQKIEVIRGQPIQLNVSDVGNGLYLLRLSQMSRLDYTKQVVIQK